MTFACDNILTTEFTPLDDGFVGDRGLERGRGGKQTGEGCAEKFGGFHGDGMVCFLVRVPGHGVCWDDDE